MMEIPAFDCEGDEEATEEQKDDRIGVGRRGLADRHHAGYREQNDWEQRSDGDRDGFGNPPENDPGCSGRNRCLIRSENGGIGGEEDDEGQRAEQNPSVFSIRAKLGRHV